jgi:hypothetical protein
VAGADEDGVDRLVSGTSEAVLLEKAVVLGLAAGWSRASFCIVGVGVLVLFEVDILMLMSGSGASMCATAFEQN